MKQGENESVAQKFGSGRRLTLGQSLSANPYHQ
jgi:hypothetical protein